MSRATYGYQSPLKNRFELLNDLFWRERMLVLGMMRKWGVNLIIEETWEMNFGFKWSFWHFECITIDILSLSNFSSLQTIYSIMFSINEGYLSNQAMRLFKELSGSFFHEAPKGSSVTVEPLSLATLVKLLTNAPKAITNSSLFICQIVSSAHNTKLSSFNFTTQNSKSAETYTICDISVDGYDVCLCSFYYSNEV